MSPRRLAARSSRGRALAALAAGACLLGVLAGGGSAAAAECPNEALRVGFSAHLPECRAYEVVSPELGPARPVFEVGGHEISNSMNTWPASPNGESVTYGVNGGIQNEGGTGASQAVESLRGPGGWVTHRQGPSSEQSGRAIPVVGGAAPNHGLAFFEFTAYGVGTLGPGSWLRERGGGFSRIGSGSLGVDPSAQGLWITDGGTHVIFENTSRSPQLPVRLEPEAPPAPIETIYDRHVGGSTDVVSLLPGDDTPAADALYLGSSVDGAWVAFEVNGTMYMRRDDVATQAAAYSEPGTGLICNVPNLAQFAPYSVQWLRNGVPIAGATESRYTVQAADEGKAIQCRATTAGSATSTSVPPTLITTTEAPIAPPQLHYPLTAPAPANPTAGTLEACPAGEWSGSPTLAYQWYRNGEPIAGAASDSYELQGADVPSTLQCSVSAENGDGTVVAVSAANATSPAPAAPGTAPIVDVHGQVRVGGRGGEPIASFAGAGTNGRMFFAGASAGRNNEATPYDSFKAFDPATDSTTDIADEGSIWPARVSEDGSHAYFVSTAVLSANTNAVGDTAEAGEPNLYVWSDAGTRYIATVSLDDVAGSLGPGSSLHGFALWTSGLDPMSLRGNLADPARTTPDGSVFVFQSRKNLIPGYDSQGHSEIFRFDAASEELTCVSCNPAGTPATADAELASTNRAVSPERIVLGELAIVPNVSPDGETIIFNTRESLLPSDEDEFYDVYQWRAGELGLVSSGQSDEDEFLYGMSADGRDVFFVTDLSLTPQDEDGGAASIYDARVDGGFPPPLAGEICEEEGCQGQLPAPPPLSSALTPNFQGVGNVHETPAHKHKKKKRHSKKKKRHAHKAKKGGKR